MIDLDPTHFSCGCVIEDAFKNGQCDCKLEPFTVTRSQLRKLLKWQLYLVYTRCVNDEMSPRMWRGFTKVEIVEMFLIGESVELTPFI